MADKLNNLLLHPKTLADGKKFTKNPGHALLLVGVRGAGKDTLADSLAAEVLKIDADRLEAYPHFIRIKLLAEKQEISIDALRDALRRLNLKTQGESTIRRIIVINDAQLMSHAAQNSLLKNLEEPASDTIFILTAPSRISLLPTIVSRTWQLNVHPVDLASARSYYGDKFSDNSIGSAWMMSGGSAGLLDSLLNESDHPLKIQIDEAKKLLRLKRYERLLALNLLSKDRIQLASLLEALRRVLDALQSSPSNKTNAAADRLLRARKLVIRLEQATARNANPRLIALELALNLEV